MLFRQIYESRLSQYAYLIGCQRTGEAILVDPMRDVDRYFDLAADERVRIVATTETHIHADYLSGVRQLAARGIRAYLSDEGGEGWRYAWARTGDAGDVVLLKNGDRFEVGDIDFEARHTPGHTPEHMSFLVTDRGGGADEPMGILSGDFVFVGDLGRPDLLESAAGEAGAMRPAAAILFQSVQGFLEMPDFLQVWPGHGSGSACGKALGAVPESTVGYEKRFNRSIQAARRGADAFVKEILDGQPEPPLYFGRMKVWNRDGAPLLESLPRPKKLQAAELVARAAEGDVVVLDTRERRTFMASHLAGSISAPLDRSFPTIAGSYVLPEQGIVLLAEEEDVEEAVRELVRIGLDDVRAWAPPSAIHQYEAVDGETAQIPAIRFADFTERPDAVVLDVRRRSEFDDEHVDGALNIAHTRLLERHSELPMDKELLVHCMTGPRAASAASMLAAHGYRVVWVDDNFVER